MKEITKKDITSSIGLILMFALGWIASGLVENMGCDACDYNNKMQRQQQQFNQRIQERLERMNHPRPLLDFEMDALRRNERRQRPNPNDTHTV